MIKPPTGVLIIERIAFVYQHHMFLLLLRIKASTVVRLSHLVVRSENQKASCYAIQFFTRYASRTTLHEIVILLDLKLGLVQPGVDSASFHEGVMVPLFDNRPPLHDDNAIHIVERRQPVRNNEGCAPRGELI